MNRNNNTFEDLITKINQWADKRSYRAGTSTRP